MAIGETLEDRVSAAVDAWLRWLPGWQPGSQRARSRICRRCMGSPILAAAGLTADVPHQVAHALTMRMQRIIDRTVDEFTSAELPALQAELDGDALWKAGGFDPVAGLEPEYEGVDLDPEPVDAEQPFLFTLGELAEQSRAEPPLPRPPLSAEEKRRLRSEIELADRCAVDTGQGVCFALVVHRPRIQAAVERFVEPQVQALLSELSKHLEPPQ